MYSTILCKGVVKNYKLATSLNTSFFTMLITTMVRSKCVAFTSLQTRLAFSTNGFFYERVFNKVTSSKKTHQHSIKMKDLLSFEDSWYKSFDFSIQSSSLVLASSKSHTKAYMLQNLKTNC